MPRTTTPGNDTAQREPLFVSAKEAAHLLDLSPNEVYNLLDRGLIESRYHGKRRLVSLASVKQFADSLPTERAV